MTSAISTGYLVRERGGWSLHRPRHMRAFRATLIEMVEHLASAETTWDGHPVVITTESEVLNLADEIRAATGVDICPAYDEKTRKRLASAQRASTWVTVATDASVRSQQRGATAMAAFDGESILVGSRRVSGLTPRGAEVSGILAAASASLRIAPTNPRRVLCDSTSAIRAVHELSGADDQEVANFCQRELGLWTYTAHGRQSFEHARTVAKGLAAGRLSLHWVRGHDDDSDTTAHHLNVIADQVARAYSRPGRINEADRAFAASVAREIAQQRFPGVSFEQSILAPAPGARTASAA